MAALLNRGQQQPEENKGQLQSSQNRGHQQQSHQSLKMPLQPPPQPPKLPQKMPQQQQKQHQHDVLLPSQQQKPKTNSVASTNGLQEQHGHHHHHGLQQRQQHARQQPQNREKLPNDNIDNMLIPSVSNKSRRSSAPVPTAQELKSKQTAAAAADGVVNSSNHSNRKWSAQYPNNTQ